MLSVLCSLIVCGISVYKAAKSAAEAMGMGPSVAVAAPSSRLLLLPSSAGWQPTMANCDLGKRNIRLNFV